MKSLIKEVISLGLKFAELASKCEMKEELTVIGVEYDELFKGEVFDVRMGNISVDAIGNIKFRNPEEVDTRFLKAFLLKFGSAYLALEMAYPIIEEKARFRRVEKLQKEIEELVSVV